MSRQGASRSDLPLKNHAMMPEYMPLKFLLCVFAGWIHRQQGQVIDYLIEEKVF